MAPWPAGSLATDAAGTLGVNGGGVHTTGTQSYGERMVLGSDTVLTGSTLTLSQGADATVAGQQGLTVTGHAVLPAALGANAALKSLAISGDASLDGGAITTTGAQTYTGAVALGADTQLTGTGISFGSSVNGAVALTVQAGSGAASFGGAVGHTTRLGALTVNSSGATTLGGAVRAASVSTDAAGTLALNGGTVDTTGAQSYVERAVLGADTTLTGSSLSLSGGADASSAGGQSLTLAGPATLAGAFGAQRALRSFSATGTSALGSSSITTTGAQAYTGAVTLTGDQVLSGTGIAFSGTLDGAFALTVNSGSGDALFAAALGGNTRLGAVTVSSSGATSLGGAVRAASVSTDAAGTLALNGGSVNTTGAQSYGERAVLGADTTLAGSALSLTGGADAATAGGQSLTVAGNATLVGAFGANQALSTLSVTGASTLGAGAITTTGAQTYAGAVVLTGDQVLTGSTLTLGQGADASVAGQQGLVLTGNAVLSAALGANAALNSLAISGDTTLNGGAVTTSEAQVYSGAVALGADTQLTGTGVAFGGPVDGGVALTVQAGSGAASFGGSVGHTTRLGAVTVNSSGATTLGGALRAASVSTDAAGTLALNGGSVHTTGAQSYGERAVLGADTTLTGSALSLAGGADGITAGGQSLMLAGPATLAGAFGAQQTLRSLAVTGTSALGASAITTTGAQTYAGAVTLTGDQVLNGNGISFAGTLDGAHALALTGGDVLFGAALGGGTRLGAVTVASSGATTFGGTVRAASVSTDAAGTLALNGGSVHTTGAQSYGERAVLGADTTLTGSALSLTGGADAATAGGQSLTVAGNATLVGSFGANQALSTLSVTGTSTLGAGAITTTGAQTYAGAVVLTGDQVLTGSTLTLSQGADASVAGQQGLTLTGHAVLSAALGAHAALKSLAISGDTTLNGGAVTTSGAQTYSGAVALGADTQLTGTGVALGGPVDGGPVDGGPVDGGPVDGGPVDGGVALTVQAGSGAASFGSTVGHTTRLGAVTVNSSGATTFGGAVRAASVSTDAAGTLALNGGSVNTTGAQSYGERAVLGADTTLTGSALSLTGGADATMAGGQSLTLAGNATLAGSFGANRALSALSVTGTSTLGAGAITTTGGQTYTGAATLTADQTLASSTGHIAFGGTLDGGQALTLDSGSGNVTFSQAVGGSTRVGALVIRSSGATRFDGTVRAASVSADAAGTLALNGGTVDTTGAQSYGERAVLGADTTLTASTVHLQDGADATSAGVQGLAINGNAILAGAVGAHQALRTLSVSGTTTLAAGSVTSTGEQSYAGAVDVTGDQALSASTLGFGSTLDSTNAANLSLSALAGAIDLGADVGHTGVLGALTLRSGTTTRVAGGVKAGRIVQTSAGGLSSFGGAVTADDVQLSGHSFRFDGAVTARTGALAIDNTDATGTAVFARDAAVQAATGFTQTGGASLLLPATIVVTQGGLTLEAPASLPVVSAVVSGSGVARITTDGDIRMVGLVGATTALALNAGTGERGLSETGQPTWRAFGVEIGLNDANPDHKINVANLAVATASAAKLYGTVAGKTGALAASTIDSALVNAPYFINDTPWGPLEVINRLVATTVPLGVVPSTPGVTPLFTGVVDRGGVAPNVLGVYASPQVLTVAPMSPVVLSPVVLSPVGTPARPGPVSAPAPAAAPVATPTPAAGNGNAAQPEDSPR